MGFRSRSSICTLVGAIACPLVAGADTLTFNDVVGSIDAGSQAVPAAIVTSGESAISDGYGGLNWTNFWVLNSQSSLTMHTGYGKGAVYGDYVAYNHAAAPASVSSDAPFTFNSVYLTAAWNNGLNIKIDGYADSDLKYSQTIVVSTSGPTLFTFDWADIDGLTFTSWGGSNAGLSGWGEQLAMDGFTFNAESDPVSTPLPLGVWGGMVLMGVIGVHRIRRRMVRPL